MSYVPVILCLKSIEIKFIIDNCVSLYANVANAVKIYSVNKSNTKQKLMHTQRTKDTNPRPLKDSMNSN